MAAETPLAKKLQLKPGDTVWVWPETTDIADLLSTVDARRGAVDQSDVALLFPADRQGVEDVLAEFKDALAAVRVVWIVYEKANRTDINRDSLWVQLAGHGWKAVSQVSYSEILSALRVRPLRDGEPAPV